MRTFTRTSYLCLVTAMSAFSALGENPRLLPNYGHLPTVFEENAATHSFIARGAKYAVRIQPDQAVLSLSKGKQHAAVIIHIEGANADAAMSPLEPLLSYSNYYIGNDPSKWREHVPHYGRVQVAGVQPGVDVQYYGTNTQLEYDFNVAPGASTKNLRLRFDGEDSLEVNAAGDLLLHTRAGDLTQHKPVAWQTIGGKRRSVEVRYAPRGASEVLLRMGRYDHSYALTIDPVLSYSTYLAGMGNDNATAIAVDSSGAAYIAGSTTSSDFPVTGGAFSGAFQDAFVTKINPAGTALVYSVFLGGESVDAANAIAIDNLGNAYVAGITTSVTFPVMGLYSALSGSADAFITKLNSSGKIVYSRFLGGTGEEAATGIAVDATHEAFVTGTTTSTNFPTTAGARTTSRIISSTTGFVAKLNPTANILYATYLGGSLDDEPAAIQVDIEGNAYIAGSTVSADFPAIPGAFQTAVKVTDVFVSKLNPAGNALLYSTLLGGSNVDLCYGLQVDGSGNAYVIGTTDSPDFPTTPGAYSTTRGAKPSYLYSVFVTKINPSGAGLVYSTYAGGTSGDFGLGLVVDSLGEVFATGITSSTDFPTTAGSLKTSRPAVISNWAADSDSFVFELNPSGSELLYSTYLGGTGSDGGSAIASDGNGGIYVAGFTGSTDFPVTQSAFQTSTPKPSAGSGSAGFVAKINFSSSTLCEAVVSSNSANLPGNGGGGSFAFTLASGCPWVLIASSGVTITTARSGTGSGMVSYSVPPNGNTTPLKQTITIDGGTVTSGTNVFTINQAAASCFAQVFDSRAIPFGAAGGIYILNITQPSGCSWNVVDNAGWVTASSSSSSGTGILQLSAAPNNFAARTATITVAGSPVTITQAAGACTDSVSGVNATYPATAGPASVTLSTSGTSCAWQAYALSPWLQVASTSVMGTGPTAISFSLADNPGSAARTGMLLIGDQMVQITQAAGPAGGILNYTDVVVAGSPFNPGYSGDGGPATAAVLESNIAGLAFDSNGNLYLSDSINARVRVINSAGIINTIAGGGTAAPIEGGSATAAKINPGPLAVHSHGAIYIVDSNGNRVWKVYKGVITTFAGTGVPNGGVLTGLAVDVDLSSPSGIALDAAGNAYISDLNNYRICKVDANGYLSTIAGNGRPISSGDGGLAINAGLASPRGITVDPFGNLYFTEQGRIRKISNGIITTVAGNGNLIGYTDGAPATSTSIDPAGGLVVDSRGQIYFSSVAGPIEKITPDGQIHALSFTTPYPTLGFSALALALDPSGNLYMGAEAYVGELTPNIADFCAYSVSTPGPQVPTAGSFSVTVTTGSGCAWASSSGPAWITANTTSGTGPGTATFTLSANTATSRTGTVYVAGSAITITQFGNSGPFGYLDTPANNTSNVAGAIGVTGWALSPAAVATVAIWRDPVNQETPTGNGYIFIGNADFTSGARPDVATAYPGYPNNNWGWGLQILTDELPGVGTLPPGNGSYRLHAIAVDNDGLSREVGASTITVNNAASVKPFGTIDTPGQGATVSGTSYVNFGWALTPQPNLIPIDGSTITVYIDKVAVGHPVYDNYRSDVSTAFPNLQNSSGPVGYFRIDTTKLSNGVHTISWVVEDSAGNASGLGSRFFTVQN